MHKQTQELVEHLFRHESGRMTAALVRLLGAQHLDLIEDVVQAALIRAMEVWPFRGIPDHPTAWLVEVARRKAIDLFRQRQLHQQREQELVERWDSVAEPGPLSAIEDDVLAMIFLCCHPMLPPEQQIALTLKSVCGLSTREIAGAFLSNESTIAQRIVRAKRVVAENRLDLVMPEEKELGQRLPPVLNVLYLLFTEGYSAHDGDASVRNDLCDEAIRLTRMLAASPITARPEVHALLALMLLQSARLNARLGEPVSLEEQDDTQWDRRRVAEGFRCFAASLRGTHQSRFHLEAAIAAEHASAGEGRAKDWLRIAALYDDLYALHPSFAVAVARAIAIGSACDPQTGLEQLERLKNQPNVRQYAPYHAARARFLREMRRNEEAQQCFERARECSLTAADRRYFERQLRDL